MGPAEIAVKKLRLMQALTLVGLGVTLYLSWKAYQAGPIAGCGAGTIFNCDHVLTSRWSKVFGLPVSIPGALIYITLLISLCLAASRKLSERARNLAFAMASVAVLAAAGSALWFVGLQVFKLGHLCKYCLVVHTISLTLAGMLFFAPSFRRLLRFDRCALGVGAAAALVLAQLFGPVSKSYEVESYQAESVSGEAEFDTIDLDMDEFDMGEALAADALSDTPIAVGTVEVEPEVTDDPAGVAPVETTSPSPEGTPNQAGENQGTLPPPVPSLTPVPGQDNEHTLTSRSDPSAGKRYVLFPGAKAKLNVNQWPILGSPKAEHILVELFDYTCGHCRQMNRHLEVMRSRYGSQVAVMVLPVPLDGKCNHTVTTTSAGHEDACELARLSLAIWRLRPDAFEEYHKWLLDSPNSRSAYEARAKAESIVGDSAALSKQLQGKLVGAFLSRHVKIYERAGQGALPKLFGERFTVKGTVDSAEQLCALLEQNHSVSE